MARPADGPFGRIVEQDDDLFSALGALRRVLERDGWLLQVNAARVNAWPSQMALQAGGRTVHRLSLGHPPRREDFVDAFAPLRTGTAATVEEQKAYHDTWARALWMPASGTGDGRHVRSSRRRAARHGGSTGGRVGGVDAAAR